MAIGEIVALAIAEGIVVTYPAGSSLTLPDVGTPGTYGSATQVPVLTIDAKGRVTAVTNTSISLSRVESIAKSGSAALTGAVTLSQGSNITLTQVGNDIQISSTGGGGGGVDSIAKFGDTQLTGDVTFTAGANVTLTQVGNDIEIAASGGGAVASVNGQTGVVVLDAGDIDLDPTITGQTTVQAGIDYIYGQIPSVAGLVPNTRTLSGATGEVTMNGMASSDLSLDITVGLADMPNTGDTVGGISNEVVGFSFDNKGRISNTSSQLIDNVNIDKIRGANWGIAGFDGSGIGWSIPGFSIDATAAGLRVQITEDVTEAASNTLHYSNVNLDASEDSPNTSWNHIGLRTEIDSGDLGFDVGTAGNASRFMTMDYFHGGQSDTGTLDFIAMNFNLGNGTDPIDINGVGYSYGFGQFNANVNISGPIQGYGFQPFVDAGASFSDNAQITAFYDNANIQADMDGGYTSYQAGPSIALIPNNSNYNAANYNPTITAFGGNAGVNMLAISGNFGTMNANSSWNGVNINSVIASARYAAGINVNMDNVTVYAGLPSSITEQDLTLTFNDPGDNNSFTLEYTPGATAGSEVVTFDGISAISVQIDSGVSQASQVKAALDAHPQVGSAITTTISGSPVNTQVTFGPSSFSGGENPGRKQAAYFKGDVQIDGVIEAGFNQALSNNANPSPVHTVNTGFTAAAATTTANADAFGFGPIMQLTMEAGATATSGGFGLGQCAMGMINLIQLATGASTDYVTGAFTGLILPSGDGHVDNMIGYRAIVANFGSTTTVDNVYLFKGDLPAGNPATNCWGIYMKDAPYNWLQSGLKIGGTAGSSDMTAQSLEVEGASLFNGNIGFYNTAPIAQPTSSGAATAGALYTATEQAMLQEAYDALRALGLMS